MADFNPALRARMLRQAVLQAAPDTTLAAVAAWLPPDFFSADTDEAAANEAELADMLARMATERPIEFEADPQGSNTAEPVLDPAESLPSGSDSRPEPEPLPPPTLSSQEARDVIAAWANKLSAARGALMSAVARQQAGRLRVAAAISQFVSGFPKRTREDLQREYLASEAERRQRVADGLEPPTGGTRQAPAGFLTASRFHQRGGSVNRGYGNKHVKKAASLIAAQKAAGLKPAVGAPKLPSQR